MLRRRLPIVAFVVALAAGPALLPEFYVTLLNYIGLYAIVTVGLVLLTGIAGLTSFGQAAFVGIGAYTTAYLTTSEVPEWLQAFAGSPWLALVAGLAAAAAVALLLGFLTLRLSGHYLPLGTIAWASACISYSAMSRSSAASRVSPGFRRSASSDSSYARAAKSIT